ncbi:MAG: FxLYD domain-containing protein [Candidatus Acidiferrales bacterium]
MSPEETPEIQEPRSQFPIAFAAGAIVVLLILGGVVLLSRGSHPAGQVAAVKLPYGAAEQTYAEHVHFKDIQMAKANNFLNQEFTYVAGTLSNDGARTIRALEVTVEFHDPFNQVILREAEQLVGAKDQPLGGGQRRDFQVTLEHVPVEWNQQYPSIRVTGLILGE